MHSSSSEATTFQFHHTKSTTWEQGTYLVQISYPNSDALFADNVQFSKSTFANLSSCSASPFFPTRPKHFLDTQRCRWMTSLSSAYLTQTVAIICEFFHLYTYMYDGQGLRFRYTWAALDFAAVRSWLDTQCRIFLPPPSAFLQGGLMYKGWD